MRLFRHRRGRIIMATMASADGGQGAATDETRYVLRAENISKRFGAVVALDGASLDIPAGKVTALVGDNGAGKSTLVKTLSGVVRPDGGTIRVGGQIVQISDPRVARGLGIHTVFQDLALVGSLDIVENVFLGSELYKTVAGVRTPLLDRQRMTDATTRALADLRVTTISDLTLPVESLSGGQRQTVAIASAVRQEARLLILDEPTAALGVKQAGEVLRTVERLRESGAAVLLISHNLREVFAVSDFIAVMFLGQVIGVFEAAKVTEEKIVATIVGVERRRPEAV
jgi:ABC-type sugar transport system ATPase subunit